MRTRLLLTGVLALALAPSAARASWFCNAVADPINFGEYRGSLLRSNGHIELFCSGGGDVYVQFSASTGGAGNYFPRKMSSGRDRLKYNLYTDPYYNYIWGDGFGGTWQYYGTLVYTGFNFAEFHADIRAQVFANQDVNPGTYTDTITVTAYF